MSPYDVTGLRLIHNRPWVKEYNPDVANSAFLVLSGDSTLLGLGWRALSAKVSGGVEKASLLISSFVIGAKCSEFYDSPPHLSSADGRPGKVLRPWGLQQTFNPYPDIFLNLILSMRAAWQATMVT